MYLDNIVFGDLWLFVGILFLENFFKIEKIYGRVGRMLCYLEIFLYEKYLKKLVEGLVWGLEDLGEYILFGFRCLKNCYR